MKLVETPITATTNLEALYPNIAKHIFNQQALKFYKLYALDRTQIVYADNYDKVILLLLNTKRKISHEEVDVAIHRLLHTSRKNVKVTTEYKKKLKEEGVTLIRPYKDIILIQQDQASV